MDYCLIEKWNKNCVLPEHSQAVALNEEGIFELKACGIPYITLEDFYTSHEMRGDIDRFLSDQLSWFDNFDQFLKEVFPEAKHMEINLASIYYYPIRLAVDHVILTTRILRTFMEQTRPEKIYFVGTKCTDGKLNQIPRDDQTPHPFDGFLDCSFKLGESSYSLLMERVCKDYGIAFHRISLESSSIPKVKLSLGQYFKSILSVRQLKCLVRKFLPAEELQLVYFGLKASLKARPNKKRKGRVLILHSFVSTADFIMDVRKYGFEVFFKTNSSVKKISGQAWQKDLKIEKLEKSVQVAREDLFQEFLNGEVMQWINQHCGLDISDVLYTRFRYFFYKTCPELLTKIQQYKAFYIRNGIDFVVTPNIWTIDEHAAIAAARLTPSTKSIGLAHGSDAYESKSRFFYVTRYFDIFITATKEEKEHERGLAELFHSDYPKVYDFPYLYQRLSQKHKKRRPVKRVSFAGNRRVVLFVPVISSTRPGRTIQKNQPFPMEYLQWHRALADFFSKQEDTFFIWKGLLSQGNKFDLMPEMIKTKGYENILFDSEKVTQWFPYADRVLCDAPSTAFFQSIYAHKATLALYRPEFQIVRENALNGSFGSSLRAYNTIDEGLGVVEEFIHGPREKYIVPVPKSNIFLPGILETHLGVSKREEISV